METSDSPLADLGSAADTLVDKIAGTPTEEGPMTTFSFGGATLVAEERGGDHPASAPVFVLLHGIGMGRKVFAELSVILAEHGRVISIDQPGYGQAPEPERILTMERTGDLVAAFIRDAGLARPVLIGHSMGTQVVTEVAARHPSLAGPVVLVGPTVDDGARNALKQLVLLASDLVVESPKVWILGAREYLRAGPRIPRKMKAMLIHRPEESYPKIRSRALILRGSRDPVCPPEWCMRVADAIVDSEYAEIDRHGHETMIRDPRPAAELILDFIGRS